MGVWCHLPDSSSVSVAAYRLLFVGLGSPPVRSDSFGVWSQEEGLLQISVLEMMAVSWAVASFLPQLSDQSVILMSDNATVVAYFWHQGGTVPRVLCRMATEVVFWTERHSVSLTAKYTLGKKNVLADQLNCSDHVLPTEWSLVPRVFERICGVFCLPILTSLPPAPMPSFLCMCLQFRTRWLGSRTRSNTLGTISQPIPSHHLLCSGGYCQEFFF